jgi:hypothetical protein
MVVPEEGWIAGDAAGSVAGPGTPAHVPVVLPRPQLIFRGATGS